MVWRDGGAPGRGSVLGAGQGVNGTGSAAKITIMMVVSTFLLVTIILVALQPRPGPEPQPVAEVAAPPVTPEPVKPAPAPVIETVERQPVLEPVAPQPASSLVVEQEVTRADASLLELRQSVQSREASDVLHQLAIQDGTGPDNLPVLARNVLGGFGYRVGADDRLHALLVASLSNQKSDAYIDALLNTAAARGEFTPPFSLTTPTGRLNTPALLQAMVRAARG